MCIMWYHLFIQWIKITWLCWPNVIVLREGVRGVAGVAMATPILQIMFNKNVVLKWPKIPKVQIPQNPNIPKAWLPKGPNAQRPKSPKAQKPEGPKAQRIKSLKVQKPKGLKAWKTKRLKTQRP